MGWGRGGGRGERERGGGRDRGGEGGRGERLGEGGFNAATTDRQRETDRQKAIQRESFKTVTGTSKMPGGEK